MRILVNDEEIEITAGTSVADLLLQLNHPDSRGLAVAVNDCVYPRSGWPQQTFTEGDRITLIRAAAGG